MESRSRRPRRNVPSHHSEGHHEALHRPNTSVGRNRQPSDERQAEGRSSFNTHRPFTGDEDFTTPRTRSQVGPSGDVMDDYPRSAVLQENQQFRPPQRTSQQQRNQSGSSRQTTSFHRSPRMNDLFSYYPDSDTFKSSVQRSSVEDSIVSIIQRYVPEVTSDISVDILSSSDEDNIELEIVIDKLKSIEVSVKAYKTIVMFFMRTTSVTSISSDTLVNNNKFDLNMVVTYKNSE